jgi:hypothetical protein
VISVNGSVQVSALSLAEKTASLIKARNSDYALMIPLPAGHESFVRIGAPANALSAGAPIRTKALRALCALAVQSFSFRTRSFIGGLKIIAN